MTAVVNDLDFNTVRKEDNKEFDLFTELSAYPSKIPMKHPHHNDVVRFVGNYSVREGYEVQAVCPSGSDLYRTVPTIRNNYNFVIFTKDEQESYTHVCVDDVEIIYAPMAIVHRNLENTQVIEALFGVLSGHALYTSSFDFPFNTIKLQKEYFNHISELVKDSSIEPKHRMRWNIYLKRNVDNLFDPRLTTAEKQQFFDLFGGLGN